MIGKYVTSLSGEMLEEDRINKIAQKVVALILSELPEEAQTYDMALYILRTAKGQIKGTRIMS